MANKTYVAYCGGKMECDGYKSPRKQNVSNLHDGYTVSTTAKNQTDADAFIFQQTIDDNTGAVTDVQLHVFKTCCSPRMKCTYSGAGKIIADQTYIWQKVIDNKAIRVMADYDKFTDKDIRIGSYGSGEKYEGFASPSSVEFYFINGNAAGNDIPESTNIGMFEGVTTLTTCNVPCQMRFISENTFKGCTSLTSYSENPDFVDTIGESAFKDCSGMQTIVIGKNAVISSRSFANCSGADTIEWHNTKQSENKCRMRDIPTGAFANCSSLRYTKFSGNSSAQDAIIIPHGISGISSYAFSECKNIRNLYMYDVKKIGDRAFEHCANLRGITGMTNVTSVGENAFNLYGNSWTTSTMGDLSQMDSIGTGAFMYVNFDGSINLTNSNLTLNDSAFLGATINGDVTVGSNIYTVPYQTFYGATITGDVSIDGNKIGIKAFGSSNIGGSFSFSNIEEIDEHAFNGASFSNTSLDLSNVTTIYPQAFNYCNVTDITFGNVNLHPVNTSYGAIEYNSSLESITFNGSVSMHRYDFASCSAIKYITVNSEDITRTSTGQFSSADNVEITLGSSVMQFSSSANGFFNDVRSISAVKVMYYSNVVQGLTNIFDSSKSISFKIDNSNLVSQYTTTYSATSWTFSAL